jgi:hypothetical protein
MAPGFGPVQENGIGVGYDLLQDCLIFTITGLKSHGHAAQMHTELEQALDEMSSFVRTSQATTSTRPNSKL